MTKRTACTGPNSTRKYVLVDGEVKVGRLYNQEDIGWNNYEAFMQLGELYSMKKDNLAADYYHNALRIKPMIR